MFRGLTEAMTLARSGIIDREYYQAQSTASFGNSLSVARHYLSEGAAAGLSVHPLFEPSVLDASTDAATLTLRYLTDPKQFGKLSPHPAFELALARRWLREAGLDYSDGVWLAWVRSANPHTPVPRVGDGEPVLWGPLRAAVVQAAADWTSAHENEAAQRAELELRHPGRTSIVVVLDGDLKTSLGRLSLLKASDDREMIATGFGSRAEYCCYAALAESRPITLVRAVEPNVARQWNLGAGAATGERLVFVAPNATLAAAAVPDLIAALSEPDVAVAQPLNETTAMTIASAGAYFPPDATTPSPLLAGHPTADADRVGTAPVPAALSGVIAVGSEAFAALDGFDEALGNTFAEVDLSLRAAAGGGGARTVVVPAARTTVRALSGRYLVDSTAALTRLRARHPHPSPDGAGYLRAAGFVVVGQRATTSAAGPILARPTVGVAALPRLRWTIDTPVTAGWWAQIWGDWHFANSLARALRRLGQDVAVDTRQARGRESRDLDDVLVTLRGKEAVPAARGRVSLLWIISHPDEVTAAELVGYDRVFAASVAWSKQRSAEWGIPIEPLLQCTDAELFHPGRATASANERALFVGNYRLGRTRPIVAAALDNGIELDLYGTGWNDLPAAVGKTRARRVANQELGRLYAEAGVVLNDHWDDMRAAGFISNRLFDAVACGARVLSDPVLTERAGLEELFDGCVQIAANNADVSRRLRGPLGANWPEYAARLAVAERVRQEHSFDARAKVMLDSAIAETKAK